ncbi:hypothetical protein [Streptomyces sp. AC550_RSS872]|uniref:hypothetical protein n=1 Tax=Streptomyces sp. AC550_RSS872 TaxID=2823689 RepID=UPI001C25DFC2|nr:hypothetical protein [Streptomyces sp. AC550_RSS872]
MTTRFDDDADDPGPAPDDPLAVILAPSSDYLAPPPGSYESIRRRANRRRLVRTAIGAGATCAVALLAALPLHLATSDGPPTPVPPLAPPPATDRTTPPSPSPSETPTPSASPPRTASPTPTVPPRATPSEPTETSGAGVSRAPSGPAVPTAEPTAVPSVPPTGEPTRGVTGSGTGAARP